MRKGLSSLFQHDRNILQGRVPWDTRDPGRCRQSQEDRFRGVDWPNQDTYGLGKEEVRGEGVKGEVGDVHKISGKGHRESVNRYMTDVENARTLWVSR